MILWIASGAGGASVRYLATGDEHSIQRGHLPSWLFVIQGSQNRDTDIINTKLNEIILNLPNARDEFLDLDDLSEYQLRQLNACLCSPRSRSSPSGRNRTGWRKPRREA
jgi:Low affinity iron permease